MSEVATFPALAAPVAKEVAEKPKISKATHPSASQMVFAAVKELKDRIGSSLQAIKKYIATQYVVDPEKQALFIKKAVKAAVANGTLVQTKGSGAAGSFKLAVETKEKKAPEAKPSKTKTGEKAVKAPKAKTGEKSVEAPNAKTGEKAVKAPKAETGEKVVEAPKAKTGVKAVKAETAKPKVAAAAKETPKKAAAPKAKKPAKPKAAAAKKPAISKKTTKSLTSKPKSPKPKKGASKQ